jgi:uncharacterized protein YndB with AHSA1/START domain
MTSANHELTISRLLNAPRSSVWQAWSDPQELIKWWCPRPWTTELRGFDLRPGGTFYTFMRGPDGDTSDNPGVFLEILPQERIVFTSALLAGWCPATPWLAMTAIITMEAEDASTRYTARVLHKDAEDQLKHEEMGFYEGWGICIDQLGELARELALSAQISRS